MVNDVSLTIGSGSVVGLLGPNGAGKTTTFYMITGLIKPDQGEVYLDDQDISLLPVYLRARLGINYLPQETSVFRKLTVSENILAILETVEFDKTRRSQRLEELFFQEARRDGLKLLGPSSRIQVSYFLTSPLRASIPSWSSKYKRLSRPSSWS